MCHTEINMEPPELDRNNMKASKTYFNKDHANTQLGSIPKARNILNDLPKQRECSYIECLVQLYHSIFLQFMISNALSFFIRLVFALLR